MTSLASICIYSTPLSATMSEQIPRTGSIHASSPRRSRKMRTCSYSILRRLCHHGPDPGRRGYDIAKNTLYRLLA
ncbi:hypothetical protein AG1IA_05497 [Rhizoctonia solani AG-1 IA]|uniref:Uncharacterized protein n=1 Tax=Thanatephorus cucumeris (strain AG1-IA) TaxID=983506 RepID=L8WQQ6_THACA|nr:hypothetical protein AG1IA_05497 [Rhizoctonia solani AG-1 IA]